MNKTRFLWILAGILLVFSCSKNTREKEDDLVFTEGNGEVILESAAPEGVFVIDGALYELRSDQKMYWKANINAGDTVGWTGELQEAVRSDNEKRNFYRVEYNGEYWWVQEYFIAGPGKPAVIAADETVMYTRPDLTAVARTGTVTLTKYTLVAMLNDTDLTDDFIPIAVHLGGAKPDERYVKVRDISWDFNDVGCVKLARVASVTKNSAARKELLKNAMEMAERSKSFTQSPQNADNDPVLFELEITNNLELFRDQAAYMVTSETVNMRDLPSVNGSVSGTMNQGEIFWVNAAAKKEITLEAAEEGAEKPKGRWLRTEKGQWVFSAFAVPNPAY